MPDSDDAQHFYYFAYGSNMLSARLAERCPSAKFIGVAHVNGYALSFSKLSIDRSGKATLEKSDATSIVYGVIFEIKTDEGIALDQAEGLGTDYAKRIEFTVVLKSSGLSVAVVTYIAMPDKVCENLSPQDWYLDLIIAGAKQHKLSPDYISMLCTVPCISSARDNAAHKKAAMLLRASLKT